jgi:hypothetical protein
MKYDEKSRKMDDCYIQYCEVDYDQKGKYELQYSELTEYIIMVTQRMRVVNR